MQNNNWTVGKGIGFAGKWIAIAIIIASLFSFINNRFRDDNYYGRPMIPPEKIEELSCSNPSYEHPLIAYCAHMGYNATLISTDNIFEIDGTCTFDDGNTCILSEFYYDKCGIEYQIEVPCRKKGEVVFSWGECCKGLRICEPDWVLGQDTCE